MRERVRKSYQGVCVSELRKAWHGSFTRKLYYLWFHQFVRAVYDGRLVVSLVCVCLGKSNLLNKFIFSDSALDFRRLFFSTEEIEKWNGETLFLSSHKKTQHIKQPNEHSSSFHAWKFPVTWHYKLNQLYDLTFVAFYLRGSRKHKFKTPLSNQFAYCCSEPFIGYLLGDFNSVENKCGREPR